MLMEHLTFFRVGIAFLLLTLIFKIISYRNESENAEHMAFWSMVFGVLLLSISFIATLWPVMA